MTKKADETAQEPTPETSMAEAEREARSAERLEDLEKAADKADLPAMEWPQPPPSDVQPPPVQRYRPNVNRADAPPKEDEITAEERRAGGAVYVVETDQWGHDEAGGALMKGDLFQAGDLNTKTHDLAFALRTGAVRRAPEHVSTYTSQK